jgi:hypothetical protein
VSIAGADAAQDHLEQDDRDRAGSRQSSERID